MLWMTLPSALLNTLGPVRWWRTRTSRIVDHKRISWIFFASSFGFLVLSVLGGNIVQVLYTAKYWIMPSALFILAGGQFFNAMMGPIGATLGAYGNTRFVMINTVVMFVLNAGLDYLLIPTHGIVGASIATSLSLAGFSLLSLLENWLLHGLHPFTPRHVRYFFLMGISGTLTFFINRVVPLNLLGVCISVCSLLAFYVLGLYGLGLLDDEDRYIMNQITLRIVGRRGDPGKER